MKTDAAGHPAASNSPAATQRKPNTMPQIEKVKALIELIEGALKGPLTEDRPPTKDEQKALVGHGFELLAELAVAFVKIADATEK